mgnify:CR=1 FL=1
MLPKENSAKRAKKMSKGAAHRDATIQLVGTVDGSISRFQAQFITLQKTLQAGMKKTKEEAADRGEKTAEDKLSLTVSKNDFAQMRIIGQFNLGFIIAVVQEKTKMSSSSSTSMPLMRSSILSACKLKLWCKTSDSSVRNASISLPLKKRLSLRIVSPLRKTVSS